MTGVFTSRRTSRAGLGVWLPKLMLAGALAGCSHNPPPTPEAGTPAANIVVSVQNQNLNDVDAFANINGVPQRLGTVTSQSTNSFEVKYDQIGPAGHFSVVVSPIGGAGTYRSAALTLHPGAQVSVTVAPVLRNSTTQVY